MLAFFAFGFRPLVARGITSHPWRGFCGPGWTIGDRAPIKQRRRGWRGLMRALGLEGAPVYAEMNGIRPMSHEGTAPLSKGPFL